MKKYMVLLFFGFDHTGAIKERSLTTKGNPLPFVTILQQDTYNGTHLK
jgi:hypothetical protein